MTTTLEPSAATRPPGRRHSRRFLFATMGVSAIICLIASAVLSIDAVLLAADPGATLGCNINAAISCGAVGVSPQANILGFPNAFIGLATEPVVLTIAVAGFAGVRFPRWFMFAANVGYLLGLVFAYWLFFQSMFVIGALCPWCLTITVFTTVTFFTMLHINVIEDDLYLPERAQAVALKLVRLDVDLVVPAVILAAMVAGIILKYGVYLFS